MSCLYLRRHVVLAPDAAARRHGDVARPGRDWRWRRQVDEQGNGTVRRPARADCRRSGWSLDQASGTVPVAAGTAEALTRWQSHAPRIRAA